MRFDAACAVLQGLIARSNSLCDEHHYAIEAVKQADALLEILEK
jgi:hypothetical protein